MPTPAGMEQATFSRWRRYGHDRLYITAADGTRLGWHDLTGDASTLEQPDRAVEFQGALDRWRGSSTSSTPQQRTGPTEDATLGSVDQVDPPAAAESAQPAAAHHGEDLAGRAAGAGARQQAVALRQAAPVRTLLARALGVHTEERAWRIGADGEEKVAAQLAKLTRADPRWQCLHAIEVGRRGADLDHLVIGPAGVFTLNTKHHPGAVLWVGGNTFLVNGLRQPYLPRSKQEAARASRLLSAACGFGVTAVGVVVPVGASELTVKSTSAGVHVVNRRALVAWLRDQPEVLDRDTVEAVLRAARHQATWT